MHDIPGASLPVRAPIPLHGLLPPADFAEPGTPSPPPGAFGLLLDEITPELVGRVLGSGPSAEARWEHLAGDAAACEAIKTSVMQHHMLVDMFFLGLGLGF